MCDDHKLLIFQFHKLTTQFQQTNMTWIEQSDNIRVIIYVGTYLCLLLIASLIAAAKRLKLSKQQRVEKKLSRTMHSVHNSTSAADIPHTFAPQPTLEDLKIDEVELKIATSPSNEFDHDIDSFDHDLNMSPNTRNIKSHSSTPKGRTSIRLKNISTTFSNADIDRNRNENEDLVNMSFCECLTICCSINFCTEWAKDVIIQRSIYSAIVTYAFDIITDINVLILWIKLGYNNVHINNLDMKEMAFLSGFLIIMHRIVSSRSVYQATSGNIWPEKIQNTLLQFFDFYILIQVYKSYQAGRKNEELRWLTSMEAILESSGQIILQMVYLVNLNEWKFNDIVTIGLFFSILKLGYTAVSSDYNGVTKTAKYFFTCGHTDAYYCISYQYIIRLLFRLCELSSREFIGILIWIVGNGYILMTIIFIHLIHNIILFKSGCLGREFFPVFGYMVYIPNLNKSFQEGGSTLDDIAICNKCGCIKYILKRYTNIYRIAEYEQLTMIKIRTVELILYLIFLYYILFWDQTGFNAQHLNDSILLTSKILLYIATIACILTPLLFLLMIQMKIINQAKRSEHYAFDDTFHAIRLKRVDAIQKQFQDKQSILSVENKNSLKTPLHYACEIGAEEIVRWMCYESGFINMHNINVCDSYGRTPFYIACRQGSDKCAKTLFKFLPFNIDWMKCSNSNKSPLYAACEYNRIQMVEYLLHLVETRLNANDHKQQFINLETNTGFTALHIAAERGHISCVTTLLKSKYININICQNHNTNYAPIHSALASIAIAITDDHDDHKKTDIFTKNIEKVVILLMHDTRSDLKDNVVSFEKLFDLMIQSGSTIIWRNIVSQFGDLDMFARILNAPNKNLQTPLWIAASLNHGDIIRNILKNRYFDVECLNKRDGLKRSPLWIACRRGHTDCVLALFESDYENKIDVYSCDSDDITVFMAACQSGLKKIFEQIIFFIIRNETLDSDNLKLIFQEKDKNNRNALFLACREGGLKMVKLILESKYIGNENDIKDCINQCDILGRSSLMISIKHNNYKIVEYLIKNYQNLIDFDETDDKAGHCNCPLYLACYLGNGWIKTIKLLLSCDKIDVNRICTNSEWDYDSPLLLACRNGYSNIVSILLTHPKINTTQCDLNGQNAIQIAQNSNLDQTVYLKLMAMHANDQKCQNKLQKQNNKLVDHESYESHESTV